MMNDHERVRPLRAQQIDYPVDGIYLDMGDEPSNRPPGDSGGYAYTPYTRLPCPAWPVRHYTVSIIAR